MLVFNIIRSYLSNVLWILSTTELPIWDHIKHIPNALIVNVGDMMEIVSNGVYKSIEHRAVVNSNKKRLSLATFNIFNLDSELGPAHSLIGPHNPAKFRSVRVEKFLQEYFARKLDGKSFIDWMKSYLSNVLWILSTMELPIWDPIKHIPNALIVNVGDMMEIVSNGVYKSIEYRAVVNSNKKRLSLATFNIFNLDSKLGPAHSLIGPHNPAKFRSVRVEIFLQEYFARKLDGKSFIDCMKLEMKDDES
uniref:Uncharacterized protein LOC104247615 n=1 Tax=Nicotiana sylvestris TaxID=4096 RepID=A0A1U7YJ45_NICSY|nr:PREDICTED: uncharacterized protein LOC104247615 [Nicotiana sylvestris]